MKNNNEQKIIGSVFDLKLNNEGNFADVLVKRDSESESKLVMGQFIILKTDDVEDRVLIGTVESENPDFNMDLKEALRNSQTFETPVDQHYRKKHLFTVYRCRMIGVCYIQPNEIKYYSNIRTYPAPTSLKLYIPSNEFMNNLFLSAVSKSDNEEADVIFEIGRLQYGTDPLYTKEYSDKNSVRVQFNATNLLRKRTAIFGKSGYGKSNTVKTVLAMMSTKHDSCGQLILDTNGEYALDNSQNDGLMNIFHEAGDKNKVVVYTNRTYPQKVTDKFGDHCLKQLKFDVFDKIKPAFEIVSSNLDGRTEPLYLNPWSSALDGVDDEEKFFMETYNPGLVWGIWYAALYRAGITPYNKKHTKAPLKVSKEYLSYLFHEILKKDGAEKVEDPPKEETQEPQETKNGNKKKKNANSDYEINPDAVDILKDEYGFFTEGKDTCSNDIRQMADYAEWYVKNQMEEKSSIKGFSEILEYPRRFYALKAFNIDPLGKQKVTMSLGEAVFKDLKDNRIVILDLASVSIQVAKTLSAHVLSHLLNTASKMFGDYVQRDQFHKFDALVYIEEAQNYLKPEEVKNGSIYERLAKEGRKFHLGLVYVTQQPSAIDRSITSQTENIIAMHMSNNADCFILGEIKDKFDKLTCKFLKDEAQKGLAYIYAEPHQPFVLPCQIHQFTKDLILKNKKK